MSLLILLLLFCSFSFSLEVKLLFSFRKKESMLSYFVKSIVFEEFLDFISDDSLIKFDFIIFLKFKFSS